MITGNIVNELSLDEMALAIGGLSRVIRFDQVRDPRKADPCMPESRKPPRPRQD